jgi:hypothetical protein
MRKCRYCAKDIQDASVNCEHCGRELVPGRAAAIEAFAADTAPEATAARTPSRFVYIVWLFPMLSAIVGGLIGGAGVIFAKSAPQEASAAAIGCLIVIAPYTFARAVTELSRV